VVGMADPIVLVAGRDGIYTGGMFVFKQKTADEM